MKSALKNAGFYMGYAVHIADRAPLSSVRLDVAINLEIGVPDPIPPGERKRYQVQFRDWAIGQCLIELDQSYQRYVVGAMDTKRDINEFKRTKGLANIGKSNLANTWTVHEAFYAEIPSRTARSRTEAEYLRTLGNSRNCLAHDSGLVTARRLTEGDTMPVRWPGIDMFSTSPDGTRRLLRRDKSVRVRREDVGHTLSVEDVVREHLYHVNDQVALAPTDLAEIIFFYQQLAMEVCGEMHRFTAQAGLELNV